MSNTERLEESADRELYELLGYLLTSARGLLEEPGEYGPLRLVEGASRLCGLMLKNGSSRGAVLEALKAGIDSGKFNVMSDAEGFARTLDQAVRLYTQRLA